LDFKGIINPFLSDTIAAIVTPIGIGGIGVVRVSGPKAKEIAFSITGKIPKARFATFSSFSDSSGVLIDQGIALLFLGPNSFTGEDCLELQGHGNPIILNLLLSSCLEQGARLARPGEFSERAFLNGRIDLVQAEAIADLIESSTSLAARMAARTLQGDFSKLVHSIVDDLIVLRTLVESTLDFPEDDIDSPSNLKIDTCLINLIDKVEYILVEAHQGERIRHGLNIVIAGRPNVGKSTLLNRLLNDEAAIVNPLPGTTRDVLRFEMQVEGLPIVLVDTAGIRDTEDPIEAEGIRRARKQFETADVILWVFDGKFSLELPVITCLPDDVKLICIRNKVDLIADLRDDHISSEYSFLDISALTGQGIDLLRIYIKDISGIGDLGEGSFIARQRHLYSLEKGLASLRNANELINSSSGSEVVAMELLEAQKAFDEITGRFTTDDLLGEIFSSFCIGK
jgi:tRNA modification GTPase